MDGHRTAAGLLLVNIMSCATVAPACAGNDGSAVTPSPTSAARATEATTAQASPTPIEPRPLVTETFHVQAGTRPHDVAPALNGRVWYTAQATGELGVLDPSTALPSTPGSARDQRRTG